MPCPPPPPVPHTVVIIPLCSQTNKVSSTFRQEAPERARRSLAPAAQRRDTEPGQGPEEATPNTAPRSGLAEPSPVTAAVLSPVRTGGRGVAGRGCRRGAAACRPQVSSHAGPVAGAGSGFGTVVETCCCEASWGGAVLTLSCRQAGPLAAVATPRLTAPPRQGVWLRECRAGLLLGGWATKPQPKQRPQNAWDKKEPQILEFLSVHSSCL